MFLSNLNGTSCRFLESNPKKERKKIKSFNSTIKRKTKKLKYLCTAPNGFKKEELRDLSEPRNVLGPHKGTSSKNGNLGCLSHFEEPNCTYCFTCCKSSNWDFESSKFAMDLRLISVSYMLINWKFCDTVKDGDRQSSGAYFFILMAFCYYYFLSMQKRREVCQTRFLSDQKKKRPFLSFWGLKPKQTKR